MKLKFALVATLLAALTTGCFTPNYNKIPLQANEIPYVLADGDYKDNQGNLHINQHNMWAMSQADVFDYMKYVRQLSPVKEVKPQSSLNSSIFADEKIPYLPGFITKTRLLFVGMAIFLTLIILVFLLKRKVKKLKKYRIQAIVEDPVEEPADEGDDEEIRVIKVKKAKKGE